MSSDHLTLLGLLAMPAAGLAFAAIPIAPWSAALFAAALAVNWFGDSLDGTLARVRCQPRPRYGYYVDHVIDLAGTAALIGGMAASGLMNPTVALALLAAYFLVSAETYLATHSVGVFRLSFAGVGPTELRILLAIGAVLRREASVGDDRRPPRAAAGRRRPRRHGRARRRVHGIRDPEHPRAVPAGAAAARIARRTRSTTRTEHHRGPHRLSRE